MIKVQPVNIIANTKSSILKSVKTPDIAPYFIGSAAAGCMGILVSDFVRNFNKTADKDNYFKLKINPETGKPYTPDIFQKAAAMNLYLGNDVLVTAPTGTGKTAIAEYVITKNLNVGKRTFYTTPLKALSNEKYRDFCNIYGEENVGLLTGDTKINKDAPVVIMTTEVYRNMAAKDIEDGISGKSSLPKDVKTVIFDELQYLGDVDRGGIWEQSIMFTPKDVQILSLSATIGNNKEINDWIASVKGQIGVYVSPDARYIADRKTAKETVLIDVPSENRHVPLNFEVVHGAAEISIPRGATKKEKLRAKQEAARRSQSMFAKPRDDVFKTLTQNLRIQGKLPAIYFVFSKKESKHLLKYLSKESEILTTNAEQDEIAKIIKKYLDEGIYLGESLDTEALIKGYALHNAGMIPSQKMLVEELFQKKLIKVVIATETLSAGINMPAKTTVISSPRKPASTSDGGADRKRNLTANEFHQMAGRAGRRGIDTEGYCVSISCNPVQNKFYEDLIASDSNPLTSNMDLDYSFITNYISGYIGAEKLTKILSKSLYVRNPDSSVNSAKLNELMQRYYIRKEILKENNYIDDKGKLTVKGEMIKLLNGYEQIPLINLVNDRIFENLTPVELAGIAGGLANIEYNTRGELPSKPFELDIECGKNFQNAAYASYAEVKDYDEKSAELYPQRELNINPRITEHLYYWAKLNSEDNESKKNWKEIFTGEIKSSLKDEGTLFKEINMTADLIKQLTEAAHEGLVFAETKDDSRYYSELESCLKQALELIQREPVT